MKPARATLVALFILALTLLTSQSPEPARGQEPGSSKPGAMRPAPRGGAAQAIVTVLEEANTSVLVQAYSFTSARIATALVEAHKRRVKVEVILGKSHRTEKTPAADFLAHEGIPTRIDAAHELHPTPTLIIDGKTVITGAFNFFTRAAEERIAKDLRITRDKARAALATKSWQEHARHSDPYTGRGTGM